MATKDLLQGVAEECVRQHGAHLIDLLVRGDPARRVIEVYIDNEKGVTSDLCAEVSRSLIEVIDRSRVLTGSYRLDVSSPGIDRPLRFPWQFAKHVGRPVEASRNSGGGLQSVRGILTAADGTGVVVQVRPEEPALRIPLKEVVEIKVIAPW